MTPTTTTTPRDSARLIMLSRLMWALLGCAVACAIVAMMIASQQPSADVCQTIQNVTSNLQPGGDVPAGCGGTPAGQIVAEVAAGVFFGLGIITRIVAAFVHAGITDHGQEK
jgi:hypothetical protein